MGDLCPSLQVAPLLPGFLTLGVYDLCLAFVGPASAHLQVSNMFELDVELTDKVNQMGPGAVGNDSDMRCLWGCSLLFCLYPTLLPNSSSAFLHVYPHNNPVRLYERVTGQREPEPPCL